MTRHALAHGLLIPDVAASEQSGRGSLQYTIEARELTNEYTHRPADDVESHRTTVEALDASEAITQYVRQSAAELVSYSNPARGRESIATVRKEDMILLVRVYAD
ncbi:MAG TPA: hypothetical protein VF787_18710 [Thermoanaerobaculia bacterium]